MTNKYQNAFVSNIPAAEYRSWDAINATLLKEETPIDMQLKNSGERVLTPSLAETFATGEAIHLALLEPDDFDRRIVEIDVKGLLTQAAEKARQENPGKLIVNNHIREIALRIRDAAFAHDCAREILEGCPETEVSAIVDDRESGATLKCRIDLRPPDGANYLADVKSVSDISLNSFQRSLTSFGYIVQAAFYLDVNNMLSGEDRDVFSFILTQKSEPFHVRVVEVSGTSIEVGREVYRRRLNAYLDSLAAVASGDATELEGYRREPVRKMELTKWQIDMLLNN